MEESTSREKVLKRVRDALMEKTDPRFPVVDQESPVMAGLRESPDVTFAEELLKNHGKFIYCESEDELTGNLRSFILEKGWGLLHCYDPVLQQLLRSSGIPYEPDPAQWTGMQAAIVRSEYLIARTGSIVTSTNLGGSRQLLAIPRTLVVVATISGLVPDMKTALSELKKKYGEQFPSMVSVITGALPLSGTIPEEGLNIHGPIEIYLFMLEDGATDE